MSLLSAATPLLWYLMEHKMKTIHNAQGLLVSCTDIVVLILSLSETAICCCSSSLEDAKKTFFYHAE